MSLKILFVDDEPNILDGYKRQLRKLFEIETASSGKEALNLVNQNGPYAVIVSDMQMPEMNGVEFLQGATILAPHSVRMMLTGNADQQTASDALNRGQIFRFLTKPCTPELLAQTLQAGIAQYKLITAEKELLEKTLTGSIGILMDLLSVSEPQMFERGKKLRDAVRGIVPVLGYRNRWELEIASLLSQIGSLTMPTDILVKQNANMALTSAEREIVARIPESGSLLLAKIPRMDTVAQIIRYQNKPFSGDGTMPTRDAIPLGSRLLKILTDLFELEAEGSSRSVAFRLLRSRGEQYDPKLLETLIAHYLPTLPMSKAELEANETDPAQPDETVDKKKTADEDEGEAISFAELMVGDVMASDIKSKDGALLLKRGGRISEVLLQRLSNYARLKGIREPVFVLSHEPQSFLEAA